jgi:maleylpyruvate isomerase
MADPMADDPAAATLEQRLAWMREGTDRFCAALDEVIDALAEPSRLPGWTRAHVASHVARNADALLNLLEWARTGIDAPMYSTPERRVLDIEEGGKRPANEIAQDVRGSAARFDDAARELSPIAWSASVRTRTGRPISASEVPYMRAREVWVHSCDLGGRAGLAQVPMPLLVLLLEDVTGSLAGREDCPALRLCATDLERSWIIGPKDAEPETVRATATELFELASGRADEPALAIPAWL